MPYLPIPVDAACQIAERFEKSMVVILAHDPAFEMIHTTTYGVDPIDKELAAAVGEQCARLICGEGFERRQSFEDYRFIDQGDRANRIERLVRACQAADHAIGSAMAVRDGMTDQALQDVRDALQAAIEAATD